MALATALSPSLSDWRHDRVIARSMPVLLEPKKKKEKKKRKTPNRVCVCVSMAIPFAYAWWLTDL